MRWIVGSAVRGAVVVIVAVAVLVAIGGLSLRSATVDLLPEFGAPRIQIQSEAIGLSTEEVEQFLTVPLESEINGVAFLDKLRARIIPGLSTLDLTLDRGTNVWTARQLVSERVAQVPIPVDVGTPAVVVQPMSSLSRAMMVALTSETTSRTDLSALVHWRIRPRLLAVPGVSNVTVWGFADPQLLALVDTKKLAQRNIRLSQMVTTVGDSLWMSPLTFLEASSPGADGLIDTPNQRITVQHILPITKPKNLAEVPVEDAAGTRVGDVAEVVEGHTMLRGDAIVGKTGDGLVLVVEKFPGASTVQVDKGVREAMASMAPGLKGIDIDTTVFDPGANIERSAWTLGLALLAGVVLLVVWVWIAAWSWRAALVAGVSVFLSVFGAAVLVQTVGMSFNLMVFGGLLVATTVIVSDAVRGVLQAQRRLTEAAGTGGEADRGDLVTDATLDLRRPLGFALFMLLIGTAPLLLLPGTTSDFVLPMVSAYALAIVTSTIVALMVTPALSRLLLRYKGARTGPVARWAGSVFAAMAKGLLARPAWGLVASGVLLVAGVAGIALTQRAPLIPAVRDGSVVIRWNAVPGTSLAEMRRVTAAAGAQLLAVPGVANVASHAGQALAGDQLTNVDSAQTWVALDPGADYAGTLAGIRRTIAKFPGLRAEVLSYPELSVSAATKNATEPVTIRVYGVNLPATRQAAARLRDEVAKVAGVTGATVKLHPSEPTVRVSVDVPAAASRGLKPGDIRRQVSTLLNGILVGQYYRDEQVYDVALWTEPTDRRDVTDVADLLIDTPDSGRVKLSSVATVALQPADTVVDRDNGSRYVDVTAGITGNTGTVLDGVKAVVASAALPMGYHAEVISDFQDRANQLLTIGLAALGALVAVFLLAQAAFRSWSRAILLFVAVPLSLSGVSVVSALARIPASIAVYMAVGSVAAIGLCAGILLIRAFQTAEEGSPASTPAQAVQAGIESSSFPLVVTVVAAGLLVAPLALAGNVSGIEIVAPFALLLAGGLVTTAIAMLLALPALYARFATPLGDEAARDTLTARPGGIPMKQGTVARSVSLATIALLLALSAGALTACAPKEEAVEEDQSTSVAVKGTDLKRVVLTKAATASLGIRSEPVKPAVGSTLTVVPAGAVFYTPDGRVWAYTVAGPDQFFRAELKVANMNGTQAFLRSGPKVGTQVVVVGAPELYGAEVGVGEGE